MPGHCVFLILQINKNVLDLHYRLLKMQQDCTLQKHPFYETIVHFLSESLTPLKNLSEERAVSIHFRDQGNNAMREAGYWLIYDEAKRLKNQSTLIEPTLLAKELILPLSSIDGAILISPEAICYSVGVILDGMATKDGDSGRG